MNYTQQLEERCSELEEKLAEALTRLALSSAGATEKYLITLCSVEHSQNMDRARVRIELQGDLNIDDLCKLKNMTGKQVRIVE